MKKVLMMMLMTAIGLAAQAGVFKWGISANAMQNGAGYSNPVGWAGGNPPASTTVYLIELGQIDNVIKSLSATDASKFGEAVNPTLGILDKQITATAAGNIATKEVNVVPNSGTITVVLLILDNNSLALATQYIVSAPITITIGADNITCGSKNFSSGEGWEASYSGGWQPINIPEPATALLALAGVGLLIRRRRRA